MIKTLLAILILTSVSPVSARTEEPLVIDFGPEFTFGTNTDNSSTACNKIIERQQKHLIEGQPEGEKFWHPKYPDAALFESPHGWWFSMEVNPGVVEVKMKHGSIDYWHRFKDDMQDAIFVSAANEGYFPQLFTGGGHINIGLSGFGDNTLLVRNFIADLFNHNELFMGVFGYDTNNALPFGLNSYAVESTVAQQFKSFDEGRYQGRSGLIEFLLAIDGTLGYERDPFTIAWYPFTYIGQRSKYKAVNFSHANLSSSGRIEIRGVRPQLSMSTWIHQIELLQGRINYLAQIKEPIPLQLKVPLVSPILSKFEEPNNHVLNPPIEAQAALHAFHQYILESGVKWKDQREYLWPAWLSTGEVDRYEDSETFKNLERIFHETECERALEHVS